ncbi:thioredoxin-disulfide reductase [Sphaerochaeta globosa]|uniref:Thioredoxin reductase n=1 Tax=Sphaerochaeta globosa (strain ATCC BAA-1886 / DSM 22777 / Buddy) TaxID=158189 RepID=F0RWU1_SPHGB|nr:thioredoxin-disulfide reductase [Sphaerochaeta globosa]ADY13722.1 thioredoxin reductase [Sphaerochaeta globosa str. Buddy]
MIEQDILIIGSGVAGMSAAQYAARAGRSVTLLESIAPGGQTMYIDMIENYPGFDQPISGYEIGMKFHAQAEAFGAKLVYATVSKLSKKGEIFLAETADGETYQAKAVIFATGANHRHLGVEGEEKYNGKGVSYCGTCDGPFFKGKRILVVGGGDTALTDGIFLSKLSDHITIVHRKDRFRAQDNLVEQIKRNKNIELVMQHTITEIKGDEKKVTSVILKDLVKGTEYEREFDAVFIFVGMLPQTDLLDKTILDESGYVITNDRMETSIAGLYAAGDVRTTVFRQLITAASDGAIAAHCASEYIDELEGRAYR